MWKFVDESFKKQIAGAGKWSVIVADAGTRGQCFKEHGKGEMPVSHQT